MLPKNQLQFHWLWFIRHCVFGVFWLFSFAIFRPRVGGTPSCTRWVWPGCGQRSFTSTVSAQSGACSWPWYHWSGSSSLWWLARRPSSSTRFFSSTTHFRPVVSCFSFLKLRLVWLVRLTYCILIAACLIRLDSRMCFWSWRFRGISSFLSQFTFTMRRFFSQDRRFTTCNCSRFCLAFEASLLL